MNGWDVLNSAITLSVSSFVAFRVAKKSLEHSERQNQLRRREEMITAIGEMFEQAHSDALNEFILAMTALDLAKAPEEHRPGLDRAFTQLKMDSVEKYRRAGLSFGVIRFKLAMLKAPLAIDALREYVKYFDETSREASQQALSAETIKNETVPQLRSLAKHFEDALTESPSG
jgi:hypothetical protein